MYIFNVWNSSSKFENFDKKIEENFQKYEENFEENLKKLYEDDSKYVRKIENCFNNAVHTLNVYKNDKESNRFKSMPKIYDLNEFIQKFKDNAIDLNGLVLNWFNKPIHNEGKLKSVYNSCASSSLQRNLERRKTKYQDNKCWTYCKSLNTVSVSKLWY